MAANTFGSLFTVTTFGESHGLALGAIVDGCPPGLPLTEEDLQPDLDRRKPGQSKYTTQRREGDRVEILSGVFEGVTTGTPIGLLVRNEDQKSKEETTSRQENRKDLARQQDIHLETSVDGQERGFDQVPQGHSQVHGRRTARHLRQRVLRQDLH